MQEITTWFNRQGGDSLNDTLRKLISYGDVIQQVIPTNYKGFHLNDSINQDLVSVIIIHIKNKQHE